MDLISSITFTTEPQGSFSTSYSGPVVTYPALGEARFSLAVSYDALTSSGNIKVLPTKFALHAAYPNPFNPSTNIDIETVASGKLLVSIYDISGRLINTLLNKKTDAGYHSLRWNGQNFNGEPMPTGIYFVQVESGGDLGIRKIMLIK